MKALRLLSLIIVLSLLGILAVVTLAEEQTLQTNGGCTSAGGYDPACDVDHDDDIDIHDIQLTAGHWNETGTWTIEPHDHDDRYYTELELQSPAAAVVHWDNLISVPTGLHDGDDDSLAALSCADDQVVKWDDTTAQWVCRDDELGSGGDGDITAVYAGTGLSGGGDANDVTLALDLAYSDGRYVNEGQAGSINSTMIINGSVTVDDLADGSALSELADDDGPGSGLDADLLDGQQASAFADASHDHLGETWTGNFTPLKIEGDFVGTVFQRNAPLALHNTSNIGADGLQVTSGGDGVHVVSAGGDGMYVEAAGDDGVDVNSAGVDGVFIEHAGDDGLHVCATGTQASCVYSDLRNGVEIGSAEDDGLYVGSAGGYGAYVNDAGFDGVHVSSAGFDGMQVESAGDDGVEVTSAGVDGMFIEHAGDDGLHVCATGTQASCDYSNRHNGIEIGSAEHDGLYVGSAGGDGVYVASADDEGVTVASASETGVAVNSAGGSGVAVGSAGNDGVYVGSADVDGVHVDSAGYDGVRVDSAGWYGVYVYSAGRDGVYANTALDSGEWGLHTPDKISGSNVTLSSLTVIARVTGDQALTTGDVVTALGVTDPLPDSTIPLALVQPANTGSGIIGVVEGRMALTAKPQHEDEEDKEPVLELHSAEGPAQPGDFVALTVLGVAQVKVDARADIQPAQRLTASDVAGHARALKTVEVEGVRLAEDAPSIGIALAAPEPGQETIPVFVTLR